MQCYGVIKKVLTTLHKEWVDEILLVSEDLKIMMATASTDLAVCWPDDFYTLV